TTISQRCSHGGGGASTGSVAGRACVSSVIVPQYHRTTRADGPLPERRMPRYPSAGCPATRAPDAPLCTEPLSPLDQAGDRGPPGIASQQEVAMVQPYPSSDKPVQPERPPATQSVQNAVKLMYVGAAVSAVSLLISLFSIGGTKDAIRKARPSL